MGKSNLGYIRIARWDGQKWRTLSTPYRTRKHATEVTWRENGVRVIRVAEGLPC